MIQLKSSNQKAQEYALARQTLLIAFTYFLFTDSNVNLIPSLRQPQLARKFDRWLSHSCLAHPICVHNLHYAT